ncbi:hypothetical protein Bca52824_096886 [Brassica carinata]|uniref:Uncharacterized protein n=1 Tax=Brassica carinata TaxID=52824 RepID=A0A8X7NZA7_BRACI|nr:hypothetical protein Bca52824_096886 [Brassica carinata]
MVEICLSVLHQVHELRSELGTLEGKIGKIPKRCWVQCPESCLSCSTRSGTSAKRVLREQRACFPTRKCLLEITI